MASPRLHDTNRRHPPARISRRRMITYATVELALIIGVLATPSPVNAALGAAVGTVAVVTLWDGVRRYQPIPSTAWWLIVIGLGLSVISNVMLMLARENPDWRPFLIITGDALRFIRYALIAIGLAQLSRSTDRRSGLADLLDAGVVGVGGFLVLWALIFEPALQGNTTQPVGALTITAAAALVVFAMAVKVIFSVGVRRSPALLLLLTGVVLTLVAPILGIAIGSTTLNQPVWPGRLILWAGVALTGAAGLHPSTRRSGTAAMRPTAGLSPGRMTVFVILSLLGPYIWFTQLHELINLREIKNDYLIPVIASTFLILLLVGRLALMAKLAHDRANELSRQAAALSESVREQEALQRQLAFRALHDPLTGLANRVVLAERMEWAMSRSSSDKHTALLLLDLDGFKDINDTFGHPTGDDVLIEVARRLVDVVPADATLARLGGDEFAVFLEEIEPAQARTTADRIRHAMVEPFHSAGHELFMTASIGLLIAEPGDIISPSTALRDADLALYAAKGTGKNRVETFQPYLRSQRLDRTRLSTGLRRALIDEEFSIEYQPVVDLSTDQIIAVEALLRWTDQDGRNVPPTEFIPIAEETGVINLIGAWALRQACLDARTWYHRHGVAVSVNISGRQLDDPRFAKIVSDALEAAGLPGAALIVELTETTLVSLASTGIAVTQLKQLRDQGVRVAVDDFGTGYSSLSYVSRLPVDIIKLDRSFAQDPSRDPSVEGWAFIRAILQLVDSLGLKTIAEGIETPEQAQVLRQLRCPLAQGYLFSRPVRADVIDQTLTVSGVAAQQADGRGPFRAAGTPPAPRQLRVPDDGTPHAEH